MLNYRVVGVNRYKCQFYIGTGPDPNSLLSNSPGLLPPMVSS
jgi:hypothetical protein